MLIKYPTYSYQQGYTVTQVVPARSYWKTVTTYSFVIDGFVCGYDSSDTATANYACYPYGHYEYSEEAVLVTEPSKTITYEVQGQFTQTQNYGWNAGARSENTLDGSVRADFKIDPGSVGVVVGLNNVDEGYGYIDIDFAFYAASGGLRIVENGVTQHVIGEFSGTDLLSIIRINSEVRYLVGGEIVYISTSSSEGPVFLDTSLYAAGDAIVDASFSSYIEVEGSGGIALSAIGVVGADYSYSYGDAAFDGLTVSGSGEYSTTGTGGIYFTQVDILGAAYAYAIGNTEFSSLTLSGESGFLVGDSNFGGISVTPMLLYGVGLPGEVGSGDVVAGSMQVLGGNYDYGFGAVTFGQTAVSGFEWVRIDNYLIAEYAGYSSSATGGADNTNRFIAEYSGFGLTAQSGSRIVAVYDGFDLSVDAYVPKVLRLESEYGAYSIDASVMFGRVGSMETIYGGYSMIAYSNGAGGLQAEYGAYGLTASGKIGRSLRLVTEYDSYALDAEVSQPNYGELRAEFDGYSMSFGGFLEAVYEAYSLSAEGSIEEAVTYAAYAINISNGELTSYSGWDFKAMFEWQGEYFGVGSDGKLYRLDGASTDVSFRFRTASNDFKTADYKRFLEVILSARFSTSITVRVIDETETEYEYLASPVSIGNLVSVRTKIGHGLKSRYLALEFEGQGQFDLEQLSVLVDELKGRKLL